MKSTEPKPCCDSRVGSAILGIGMAIIAGLLILSCIVALVVLSSAMPSIAKYVSDKLHWNEEYIAHIMMTSIIVIKLCSVVEFYFSVILAIGSLKYKTTHLKAYLIYGSVKSIVALAISIETFAERWSNQLPGSIALIICSVNTMLLAMVHKAYTKMMRDRSQSE